MSNCGILYYYKIIKFAINRQISYYLESTKGLELIITCLSLVVTLLFPLYQTMHVFIHSSIIRLYSYKSTLTPLVSTITSLLFSLYQIMYISQ